MYYKYLIFVCLLLFLFQVRADLPNGAPAGTQIGFQIHSWNDIREWQAGFAKGMRMFKIDPFYKDPIFCKSQPRAKANDPRGCFVLNHDPPVSTQIYNTTDDVLNFIIDPKNINLFQGDPIKIALCFKESPRIVCADYPPQGNYWKSLIDDFFAAANLITEKFDLNLEFILDGDATIDHHPCLQNKWRPWNMTWIKGPIDAFNSNNVSFGYDRYQIYNSPAVMPLVTFAASLNFGKFPETPYPLQVWEPANQGTFEQISQVYLHWASVFKNSHDFRFAINIDPKMFEFYTARMSGKNIQELLHDQGEYPHVLVVPSNTVADQYVIMTFFSVYSKLFYSASVLTYTSYNTPIIKKNTAFLSLPQVALDFESMTASWSKNSTGSSVSVLLSDKFGQFNELLIDTNMLGDISPGRNGSLFTIGSYNYTISSSNWLNRNTNRPALMSQIFQTANCDTYVAIWHWTGVEMAPTSNKPVKITSGTCALELSHSFLTQQDAQLRCDVEGLLTMTDAANNTRGGALCLFLDDPHVIVKATMNGQSVTDQPALKLIDVGTRAQVSYAVGPDGKINTILVNRIPLTCFNRMITHGDGYCWNSEPRNKRPTPKVCDQKPQSTAYVLSYSLASFDDWRGMFAGTFIGLPVSPCHVTPLTGTWSLGSSSTGALFTRPDGTIGFASSFRGLPASVPDPPDECGRPLSLSDSGGVVLGVLHF